MLTETASTGNAGGRSAKRPTTPSSPSIADELGEETSSSTTNPIAKVAKIAHHLDEGVGDFDGAVTASTDDGHDVDVGADKKKEDAPMESDAVVAPPRLGPISPHPPPLSPVANPTPTNESESIVADAEVGGNDIDGDEKGDAKSSNAVEHVNSQDLEEGMPPLADNEAIVTNQKSRKERKEFTAAEKLQIISEIQTAPSLQSVLDKYGVSKSSLYRWRQPDKLEQLQEMVKVAGPDVVVDGVKGNNKDETTHSNLNVSGSTTSKTNKDMYRKRVMNDKLRQIKLGLWEFCQNNMKRDEDDRLAITSSLIKLKAMQIKEDLLIRHHASQSTEDLLTDEEVAALKSFLASKSWACQMGNQLGYLSSGTSIQWTDQAKANTAAFIEEHSCHPPKPKKQRMEFTAQEKLAIVQELEEINVQNKAQRKPAITVEQICRKYDTSKSSVHRWQQQYRSGRLQELATTGSGFSNSKRIFNCRLDVVKQDLHNFYLANESASLDNKIAMTFTTLQSRALATKVSLLERHYAAVAVRDQEVIVKAQEDGEDVECKEELQLEEQVVVNVDEVANEDENGTIPKLDIMSEEDVNALVNFKASNSWLREVAKKFGWKLDLDKRDTTSRSTMIDHNGNTVDAGEYNIVAAQDHQDVALSDAQDNTIPDILEEQEPIEYVVEEHMLILHEEENCSPVIV